MYHFCCRVRRSMVLFQDGVIDNKSGDTIFDCWASMTDLMSSTDELSWLQFLEVRSTLPDELLL